MTFKSFREFLCLLKSCVFGDILLRTKQRCSTKPKWCWWKDQILRLTPTQHHRFNEQSTDPKQYSRIAVAIPLLEDCVNQLDTTFLNHKKKCLSLPPVCCTTQSLDIDSLKFYRNKINLDLLQSEFEI